MAMRVLAVLALLAGACSRPKTPTPDPAATWPAFPTSTEARTAMTAQYTQRAVPETPELTPERVFAAAERAGWSTLPSGNVAVREWLEARHARWVLFGSFHDAAQQVDAFRSLVGPRGPSFTHVVLEQFRADGHWTGIDAPQSGDSAALQVLWSTGDRSAWAQLDATQSASDYTAWKYGYVDRVLDVVATARGMGVPTFGCDLPDGLLKRLPNGTDDDVLRVRELHCLLALRPSLTPVSRVAMFWGQAHVRPEGFRRFLPPGEVVVALTAIGGRHSEDAPDEKLRDRLILNDPVLVPLEGDDAALLLPDAWLGGNVIRVRTTTDTRGLVVSATTPGVLTLAGKRTELGEAPVPVALDGGAFTYLFESEGVRVVGHLDRGDGGMQLNFDVPARTTEVIVDER